MRESPQQAVLLTPTHNLTDLEYREHEAISRSQLCDLLRSPLHYWARNVDPDRIVTPSDSPALRFGTAVHMAVLEEERFDRTYFEGPQVSRSTKAWKDAAKDCPGTLLPADEFRAIQGIVASIKRHPSASKALYGPEGVNEATFIAGGLKCRADRVTKAGVLVDLKTTIDASAGAFAKSVANFNYHIQAAYYMRVVEMATGHRPRGFSFVAVEKSPPYACQVFFASSTMIAEGESRVDEMLGLLEGMRQEHGDKPWPSYSDEPTILDLPRWAIK
jgi:hypothetical protein